MKNALVTVEDRINHLDYINVLKSKDLSKIREADLLKITSILEKKEKIFENNVILWEKYYGKNSEYPVELYPKQRLFFQCGKHFKIRALSGGNRSSKSFSVGSEVAFHATGYYPSWWKGFRFDKKKHITILCVSDDFKTSREVVQSYLLRAEEGAEIGTGFLPLHTIDFEKSKKMFKDSYDYLIIKRIDGGTCKIVFRSSKAGRKLFQGFKADFVWFDEEPPSEVFEEALIRTTTTDGHVAISYTPLSGMTPFIKAFDDNEFFKKYGKFEDNNIIFFDKYKERKNRSSKVYIELSWNDIPHLTEQQKKETLDGIPEWQHEARVHGRPVLGAGAIYPFKEEDITVEDFDIPYHWPRWYGMDVGTGCTAVTLFTQNPLTEVVYVYGEMSFYKNSGVIDYAEPIHKEVTSYRWGAIDHAANQPSQLDGKSIRKALVKQGLSLVNANKSVVEGLSQVYYGFKKGKLKIFKSCHNHLKEFRIYRRNEKQQIVKEDDHHMDAMRYGFLIQNDKKTGLTTYTQINKELEDIDTFDDILDMAG